MTHRHEFTIEGVTNKERAASMAMAYRAIAIRLLQELADPKPRTLNIYAIRDELLHDVKSNWTENVSIEEEVAMTKVAIAAVDEFFAAIKID